MKKAQLLQSLSLPMLILGTLLASVPYIAIIRVAFGFDAQMNLSYTSTIMFFIAGFMAAIGGMIHIARQIALSRNTLITQNASSNNTTNNTALAKPHWLGLTLFIPIPFISFFVLLFFWQKESQHSAQLELEYKKALSFQITIHLYALLCFFLMLLLIGLLMFIMLLALHLTATLYVAIKTQSGSRVNYWANIRII